MLNFLQSYFSDRKMYVVKNGVRSDAYNITAGTPQGSCQSGLNFCIYLNDIKDIFQHCSFNFYADDLSLYTHEKTVKEIQEK